MAQATIRDVARAAEVSVASVSRVFNGHEHIRPALRERVEAAAKALRYVPHAGARNLSLARSGAIAVVLPDLHGEFFSEILRGMDREASARGLHLLLSNMHDDATRAVEAIRAMRGRVDGLVVMAPQIDPDVLFAHLPAGLPVVLLNGAAHRISSAELRIDNHAAAVAMVEHLAGAGHRAIVHLSGPTGNVDAAERQRGYESAMAARGLTSRVIAGDFSEEAGAAAAAVVMRDLDRTDAIFAANDMMAIGAVVALRSAGIAVPGQIAIAGFDDIPLARLVAPALTTMRVQIAEMGNRAVARLAGMIKGGEDEAVELWTPELIIRETTRSDNENISQEGARS